MNKAHFVSQVAAETSTTKASAERNIGAVFSAIVDALARDDPVVIAEFGKFTVRARARQGRTPRTGAPVAVPASNAPSFKPAKPFATRLLGWSRNDWAQNHAVPSSPLHPSPQKGEC